MRTVTLSVIGHRGLLYEVSPFGHLRIKDCLASPRSLSQPRYVLHRLLESRHPPYALTFLLGTVKITLSPTMLDGRGTTYINFDRGNHRTAPIIPTVRRFQGVWNYLRRLSDCLPRDEKTKTLFTRGQPCSCQRSVSRSISKQKIHHLGGQQNENVLPTALV